MSVTLAPRARMHASDRYLAPGATLEDLKTADGSTGYASALKHAAGDDQPAARTVLLVLGHFQNGVDRFLLGLVDEGAGIDDEHVGVAGVAGQLMPFALGESQHGADIPPRPGPY